MGKWIREFDCENLHEIGEQIDMFGLDDVLGDISKDDLPYFQGKVRVTVEYIPNELLEGVE